MLAFIRGTLAETAGDSAVVEAGGIGYALQISGATLGALPPLGSPVKLYTSLQVKDDGLTLYGFSTREERALFLQLLSVSGVGPKAALSFLTVMQPSELVLAVLTEDVKALCRAPGVGKKTAQRLVLELRDKFGKLEVVPESLLPEAAGAVATGGAKAEALEALLALGYSRSEAIPALAGAETEGMSTEELLRLALKALMK